MYIQWRHIVPSFTYAGLENGFSYEYDESIVWHTCSTINLYQLTYHVFVIGHYLYL